MSANVVVETRERVTRIELARIDKKNALTLEMYAAIGQALSGAEADPQVRAMLIHGRPDCFTSGNDLKDFLERPPHGERSITADFLHQIADLKKPLVAAVNGVAAGAGLALAAACDLRVAAEHATFGLLEVSRGIIPGAGGTQRLPRMIPIAKAMEMILTGSRIGAEEAKELGLVSRVVPKEAYLTEAKKVATEIATKSPVAVRMAKMAVNKAFEMGLAQGIDFERELFYLLFASEDKKEGMKEFTEKRKPG